MTIAVTIPVAASADALARSLALATSAGADVAVFAEAPLGDWVSAPDAVAFAIGRTPLPLGAVLDARDRQPLAVWEQIAVLQRIVGPGVWPLLAGWSERHARPPAALTPRPLPFAVAPWLVAADGAGVARARVLGLRCLAPPGTAADGVWGGADALEHEPSDITLIVTTAEDFEHDLRSVRAAEVEVAAREPWMGVAVERFPPCATPGRPRERQDLRGDSSQVS
jgi:hypothetical protein